MTHIPAISIIGLGNLGWNLASKFHASGIKVNRIIAVESEANTNFAAMLGASLASNMDAIQDGDLVFACVRDNQIDPIYEGLKQRKLSYVHTSGSVALPQSNGLSETGVFYPFQTFTYGYPANWNDVPVFIEASSINLKEQLHGIAREVGCQGVNLDSKARESLHVAGVIGSNFTNHLLTLIDSFCEGSDLELSWSRPLVEETIRKAFDLNPAAAQTGPAVRGNIETIQTHLDLLEDYPAIREVYLHLTKSIQDNNA